MKITSEQVKPPTRYQQLADIAMRPLMYVLGRGRMDSVQETHPWHVQHIDPNLVDDEMSVVILGDKEALSDRFGPLHHMFGGWKHYVTLEAEPPFHIGWIFKKDSQPVPSQSAINRLQIEDKNVRMLAGPEGTRTQFFAVGPNGEQIGLRKIGQGVLGDNQFPGTRLL